MRSITTQLTLALSTWFIWFLFLGHHGFAIIREHATIALTMLLGSFVAGSTSVGGGAVAFPVFTKVLHIDSTTALIFSLAIQSIGMTAASLLIFFSKIPVCFKTIRYSIVAGGLGLLLSFFIFRLQISGSDIKYLFSSFSFLVALGLLWTYWEYDKIEHRKKPEPSGIALTITCFLGGLLSGIIGTGIDFILFTVMIFIWRYDFKIAIATSVVVMACNAIIGFIAILLLTDLFSGTVVAYWQAAVPIVVVGAPLGAIACRLIPQNTMMFFLLILILFDVVSTVAVFGIRPVYLLLILAVITLFYGYRYTEKKKLNP